MKRILRILLQTIVITAIAIYVFGFWPLHDPHPKPLETHGVLAIVGAKVYVSPDGPTLRDATVVVVDGKIAAIGADVVPPAGATLVPCIGCVVTAGFWNAHVHFTQSKWSGAEWKSAGQLEPQLEDMLTSRGFTTVVDTGSNLRDTIPIRRRIEKGELAGPKIYTAGAAQYPPNGIPFYLKETLPRWLIALMPQPKTPEEATKDELRNISDGADILKLFTGSYIARGKVLPMPLANAQAAVAVAHAHGQLALAHESDLDGVKVAIASGVDVLAHAVDTTDGVDDAVLQSIIDHHMSMIPTLKMFATTVTTNPRYIDPIHAQVRRFHALGGDLIFGTDVGYMTDYTTTGEFTALADSGLGSMDILRMLTVAPAKRFAVASEKGTVEVGKDGDLVVLDRDPAGDVTAFAAVQTTIRSGKVIWQKK